MAQPHGALLTTEICGNPPGPMQVQVEKLSPILLELQVEVPADTVATAVESAYTELRRTARVRGFRKGKAPKRVLVQLYGPSIHADVAKRLMDKSLQEAIQQQAVQPLTQPSVAPAELNPKEAFSFKARFEVRPEIESVDWNGLVAKRPAMDVEDATIDEEIEKLRHAHAVEEPIEDRAAEKGDLAQLTLTFEIEGEEKSEEIDTEVLGGKILPDLDEAIAGMKPGEEKEATAALPGAHPDKTVAGKEIAFKLRLNELKKKVLPEVNDEFAKDCEYDDVAAMKTALRQEAKTQLEQKAEEEVAKQLVQDLCAKNPIPVPPSLVEQQRQMSERELQMMAQMTGQQYTPNPELLARMRADAEVKVRAGLLMAEIAKEKEVKVDQEDMEKGYVELAEQTGKNVSRIKAEYRDKQRREMLVGMILEDKVLDLMEKAANITDAEK